jgi:glutamate--cysteine ligase catalytic subunit
MIMIEGLLKVGVPQPWKKSKKNLRYVRQAGVRQFISQYNKVKDLQGDELLWGDEIEYGIFHVDHEKKEIRLCLRAKEVSLSIQPSIHPVHLS